MDEGVIINQEPFLNFIGATVTVTDNVGTGAIDITITGSGGETRAFSYFIS